MLTYVLRRMLYMPFILFGVIVITFVLFEMTSTPEIQAKLQLGEKASERQMYDWLANRGLISWTDEGRAKVDAIGKGKLSPKKVTFFVANKLEDLPDEIADKKEDIEDLSGYLKGKPDGDPQYEKDRGKLHELKTDLKALEGSRDALIAAARLQQVTLSVGRAALKAHDDVGTLGGEVKAAEAALETAKKEKKPQAEIDKATKAVTDAKQALADHTSKHAKDIAAVKAAMAKAAKDITKITDIEPDLEHASIVTNFWVYLRDILMFDFGNTRDRRPVMEVLAEGAGPSLALTLPAFLLSELICIFFGLFAAMYRQTKVDHAIIISAILLMSINSIALIMFGQKFLASDLNYFPITGYTEGLGAARFLILPILMYVVITFGTRTRFNRIIMLDETQQDYVRTARAKGASENTVLFKHVFRNSLIPLITRWAVAIPNLYLGSLVLETFFGIPGLGSFTVDAISNSDVNAIRAIVVFGAVSFMIANLMSDVLYAVVDPRVKLS